MKKASPDAPTPQDEQNPLARIVPIRTETALTRYPFHRLSKKNAVAIHQKNRTARGKIESLWEITNPPGPLAYKIDTLIVNRRIDEMRSKGEIKPLFKLGSLREICLELGLVDSGNNKLAIKAALKENAFAGVTAKLDFKAADGSQHEFEFSTTRYTVIFTGDKLTNGKKADAVHIELHPRYHEMLRCSQTRPLNYEYLKTLSPAAQRLYELLSFALFGALKHGRPNAQMRYSDFCRDAPLTRYEDWEKARKQMYKIHQQHIANEYFAKVEFEETEDEEGRIDWIMKYTPGRRAKIEFATFNEKQSKKSEAAPGPRLVAPATPAEPPPLSEAEKSLFDRLTAHGVSTRKARQLVTTRRAAVERELQAFAFRDKSSIKDAAAWLIAAIERGDYSTPPKLVVQQQRQEQQQQAAQQVQTQRQQQPAYNEYLRQELRDLETRCPAALRAFAEDFNEIYAQFSFNDEQRAEAELACFQEFAGRHTSLGIHTFPAWLRAQVGH